MSSACCGGNCECGSDCKCGNGCGGFKMGPDVVDERSATDATETMIQEERTTKGRSDPAHQIDQETPTLVSQVGGVESSSGAVTGGCKCGANCACNPCNCK